MFNFIKTLTIGFTLLLVYSQALATTDKEWKFKVFLSDNEIGEHTFKVKSENESTLVDIKADFDVYFLFINAYNYKHTNKEIWKDACLHSVRSVTNDNGDIQFVSGDNNGDNLEIETHAGAKNASGCIKSFAYWDPSFLKGQKLLNTQTGEVMQVRTEFIGRTPVNVRNDNTVANQYRVHTDEFTVDLWYSDENEWLSLLSTTIDGSVLRYEIQ